MKRHSWGNASTSSLSDEISSCRWLNASIYAIQLSSFGSHHKIFISFPDCPMELSRSNISRWRTIYEIVLLLIFDSDDDDNTDVGRGQWRYLKMMKEYSTRMHTNYSEGMLATYNHNLDRMQMRDFRWWLTSWSERNGLFFESIELKSVLKFSKWKISPGDHSHTRKTLISKDLSFDSYADSGWCVSIRTESAEGDWNWITFNPNKINWIRMVSNNCAAKWQVKWDQQTFPKMCAKRKRRKKNQK